MGDLTFFQILGETWKRKLVSLWLPFQLLLRLRQENGEFRISLRCCLGNVLNTQEEKANWSSAPASRSPRGHQTSALAPSSPWGSPEPYRCTRVPMGVIGAPPLHPSSHGGHRSPASAPGSPRRSSEPRRCTRVPLGVTRVLPLHLHPPGGDQSHGRSGPGPSPSRPTSQSMRYLRRRRGSVMLRGACSFRSSGCRKLRFSSSAASYQLAKQAGPRRWISSVAPLSQHVPAWSTE